MKFKNAQIREREEALNKKLPFKVLPFEAILKIRNQKLKRGRYS